MSEEPASIDDWVDWQMTRSPAAEIHKRSESLFDFETLHRALAQMEIPDE